MEGGKRNESVKRHFLPARGGSVASHVASILYQSPSYGMALMSSM